MQTRAGPKEEEKGGRRLGRRPRLIVRQNASRAEATSRLTNRISRPCHKFYIRTKLPSFFNIYLQRWAKRRALGWEKFKHCLAWLMLSKPGPPFTTHIDEFQTWLVGLRNSEINSHREELLGVHIHLWPTRKLAGFVFKLTWVRLE